MVDLKIMDIEQGLYAQVVLMRRKDSNSKKEKEKTKNITYKVGPQDQYDGSILIMSG